ncbi:MAG: transcription elongation factor GreA [Lachnospiraceae bacterium]|mgnify:CR=1 FL=1|nr:transcription elongation factor GreA [Lachnospiraceae bacterium]MDE7058379.1 transcription elongation factor GreA [Lachnospiraceae bacterium]
MKEKLTKKDVEKIQAEIDHRKLVLRPQILEAVKEARAQGDLSENFEYYAARRENGINNSRIRYLERMLKNSVIIKDTTSSDEVGLNKTVTVYIEEDNECETYKIVTSIRGDSVKNLISIESPLGKALLHHHIGDKITVPVNDTYSYDVIIREIKDTSDDEEDNIRAF